MPLPCLYHLPFRPERWCLCDVLQAPVGNPSFVITHMLHRCLYPEPAWSVSPSLGHHLLRGLLLNPCMALLHLRLLVRGHCYKIQNPYLAYKVLNIHLLFLLWLLFFLNAPTWLGICPRAFLSLPSQKLM